MYSINRLQNCGIFQGANKRKNYFEGWYFKHVDSTEENVLCIIPGISYEDSPGKSHSFVQVIDGRLHKTYYIKYGIGDFGFSKESFEIRVGDNVFGHDGIRLNIRDKDLQIHGKLCYSKHINWPSGLHSPNSMGWYAYIPVMECYHGVLSMRHDIAGSLSVNGDSISFDNGIGYMEKDWGTSFPNAWIWLESNHLEDKSSSIMLSVANIPWHSRSFTGFIAGLWHDGRLYKFATYTGAKIDSLKYRDRGIEVILSDKKHLLQINAVQKDTGVLLSPVKGSMTGTIKESLNGSADIKMYDKKRSEEIFSRRARCCGVEIFSSLKI
ncbi:MAG: hypothetical protein K0R84_748 [Clostridia bacterium]|jgi:hypothetical protein|nr:hypothetical protein [Clostridia bacterium]